MENIYDFVVEKNTGETYKLEDYKDYVMLIVNTASECGFTPQFEGLQKLYEKYKDQHSLSIKKLMLKENINIRYSASLLMHNKGCLMKKLSGTSLSF